MEKNKGSDPDIKQFMYWKSSDFIAAIKEDIEEVQRSGFATQIEIDDDIAFWKKLELQKHFVLDLVAAQTTRVSPLPRFHDQGDSK